MNENHDRKSRKRQEVALCILFDEAPHRIKGRTYVQKLMFLCQVQAGEKWFRFDAGDYGPFSRDVYMALDYLVEWDSVTEEEVEGENGVIRYYYEAGPAVSEVFGHSDHEDLREAVRAVFDEYPTDDLRELLDRIYSEHPEMARNSVI